MGNNEIKQPKIKNKKALIAIAVLSVAAVFATGVDHIRENVVPKDNLAQIEQTQSDESLDFYTIENFQGKNYLTLEEDDFLSLIDVAIKEVDYEYIKQGATPVFGANDSKFSYFDKYDILGVFKTESSLRLLEIKDPQKGCLNVNNYSRFAGVDKNGVTYYGPGMMSSEAVDYVVENDRLQATGFISYDTFKIDGREVKISFENLNPYDYIIQSGAKTQTEIEQALRECLILNAKCVYVTLNRHVKNYVKAGTHDEELQILNSYPQFRNLTEVERQKAFALICYNNGGTITASQMVNGNLFEKNDNGEHVINVSYGKSVMQNANEARRQHESKFTIN